MYTDLLIRIQNAQRARQEIVRAPFSTNDTAIADILMSHQYIESWTKRGRLPKRVIEIKLAYRNGRGPIEGVTFVSKPSRRIYVGYRDLKPIRQGYGIGVISTPEGIMTVGEAKRRKLGGELLFKLW